MTGLHIKTKALHETAIKRIYKYLQGTKDNGIVYNPPKKLVADCYANVYFTGLLRHENTQDPICARSRNVFVVTLPI